MKLGLASLLANLPTLGCVVAAGAIAHKGESGWGWFLVVALLIHTSVKYGGGKDEAKS